MKLYRFQSCVSWQEWVDVEMRIIDVYDWYLSQNLSY